MHARQQRQKCGTDAVGQFVNIHITTEPTISCHNQISLIIDLDVQHI